MLTAMRISFAQAPSRSTLAQGERDKIGPGWGASSDGKRLVYNYYNSPANISHGKNLVPWVAAEAKTQSFASRNSSF
jgi:hypothetical protein